MPPKNIPKNVVNPFSEKFEETWALWKAYRWEEHKFQYKGVISEQAALGRLVDVSEGDEEKAVRIVMQSISRGWMDFYQLKQPSVNGKSATKKQSGSSKKGGNESLRDQVQAAAIRRSGGREQEGNGDHLKAV